MGYIRKGLVGLIGLLLLASTAFAQPTSADNCKSREDMLKAIWQLRGGAVGWSGKIIDGIGVLETTVNPDTLSWSIIITYNTEKGPLACLKAYGSYYEFVEFEEPTVGS